MTFIGFVNLKDAEQCMYIWLVNAAKNIPTLNLMHVAYKKVSIRISKDARQILKAFLFSAFHLLFPPPLISSRPLSLHFWASQGFKRNCLICQQNSPSFVVREKRKGKEFLNPGL